jgi:hypothetical protein
MTQLPRDSLLLLLQLLESSASTFSRAAVVDFHGRKGEDLIATGLLVPAGVAKLANADDENSEVRQVVFDRERDGFGYFDPSRGWVAVNEASVRLYRADVRAFIGRLLDGAVRLLPHGIAEIVPGLVWEVGDIRLLKTERSGVWFARRLDDHTAAAALAQAATNRPSSSVRLVLTSTRADRLGSTLFPLARIVSIADVLSGERPDVIDPDILKLRLEVLPESIDEPVHLSEDGRTLTINGRHRIRLHGEIQKKIVLRLVAAYRNGKPVVASELLKGAGSASREFRSAFGPRWTEFEPYMRHDKGAWWLEP